MNGLRNMQIKQVTDLTQIKKPLTMCLMDLRSDLKNSEGVTAPAEQSPEMKRKIERLYVPAYTIKKKSKGMATATANFSSKRIKLSTPDWVCLQRGFTSLFLRTRKINSQNLLTLRTRKQKPLPKGIKILRPDLIREGLQGIHCCGLKVTLITKKREFKEEYLDIFNKRSLTYVFSDTLNFTF